MLLPDRFTSQQLVATAPFDCSRGSSGRSNQSTYDRGEAALGSTAKYVGHSESRSARFRHQRHGASLIGGRLAACRWSVISKTNGVDLVVSTYGDKTHRRASYEGLQTCGSVWSCPCCSARISETRRGELNQALSWAREAGHRVAMVTLTARHGVKDPLGDLLNQMKGALRSLRQHRTYRRLKARGLIGTVTATEVTHGRHGWHVHFHILFIFSGEIDLECLRQPWLTSLNKTGLDGNGAAFDVQNAEQAGNYFGKWGAAEELALSGSKKSRAGRTPQQLLAASSDEGDRRAGHLWLEFSKNFKGRRQLIWSDGLKKLVGIGEIDDEEAAEDQKQDDQVEIERANILHKDWKCVAKKRADRRSDLLDRAEQVGALQAVEEIDQHMSDVIDDDDPFIPASSPNIGGLRDMLMKSLYYSHPPDSQIE